MRMWMINPKLMCNQHLLGEHVECHMFIGAMEKLKSMTGFIDKRLLEIHNIKQRHEELVAEMHSRGMKHNSILDCSKISQINVNNQIISWDWTCDRLGDIDKIENVNELFRRCDKCREKQTLFNANKELLNIM